MTGLNDLHEGFSITTTTKLLSWLNCARGSLGDSFTITTNNNHNKSQQQQQQKPKNLTWLCSMLHPANPSSLLQRPCAAGSASTLARLEMYENLETTQGTVGNVWESFLARLKMYENLCRNYPGCANIWFFNHISSVHPDRPNASLGIEIVLKVSNLLISKDSIWWLMIISFYPFLHLQA